MRLAAFGDIHSNHFALEACMDQAERAGIDGVLFLGDYVSDCSCPQKTLTLLRQIAARYPAWFIRGNREEYMLSHAENPNDGWARNSHTGSFLYTFDRLTPDDLAWFSAMPISTQVEIGKTQPFEICHGTMNQTRIMALPERPEMDAAFASMETELMLCAHMHRAFILERNGQMIVNGGTVGISNGHVGAEYALLEWKNGRWLPELRRAPYDVDAVVREFYESGFMDHAKVWAKGIARTLQTGQNATGQCLMLVQQYSQETGLPTHTEALWQRAAEELGL